MTENTATFTLEHGKEIKEDGRKTRHWKTISQLNAELALVETRRCSRCKHTLPIDRFRTFTKKTGRKYFKSMCIVCCYDYDVEKRVKLMTEDLPKYIRRYRNSHLKIRYGITMDDFERMKADQKGLCDICNQKKKLTVDHCHGSKNVRGLLCGSCNRGIGLFADSPTRLESAVLYVKKHAAIRVQTPTIPNISTKPQ